MSGFFRWYFSPTNVGEKRSYVGVTALLMLAIFVSIAFAPWHKGEAHHTFWLCGSSFLCGYWVSRWAWWTP